MTSRIMPKKGLPFRGRHKWKFSPQSVPKIFSGRYPVPIGTQLSKFAWYLVPSGTRLRKFARYPVPCGTQLRKFAWYPVPSGTQLSKFARYPVPSGTQFLKFAWYPVPSGTQFLKFSRYPAVPKFSKFWWVPGYRSRRPLVLCSLKSKYRKFQNPWKVQVLMNTANCVRLDFIRWWSDTQFFVLSHLGMINFLGIAQQGKPGIYFLNFLNLKLINPNK